MSTGTALIHLDPLPKSRKGTCRTSTGTGAWDWLPFPCAIPWREIVLSIPGDKYMEDPVKSLKELMSNITEERLVQLQQASLRYTADIDWAAHNSRVLENFLRESYHIPCQEFERSIGVSKSVPLLEQPWCVPQKTLLQRNVIATDFRAKHYKLGWKINGFIRICYQDI